MKKLFDTLLLSLLHPDREEDADPERAEVAKAANILQVGEFQLLQLAYHEWHGQDLPPALIDRLFTAYMLRGEVPHWGRSFARFVIEQDGKGMVNVGHPFFHRYDNDYATEVPKGVRRFCHAALILVVLVGGSIFIGHFAAGTATSVLPPYFEKGELQRAK